MEIIIINNLSLKNVVLSKLEDLHNRTWVTTHSLVVNIGNAAIRKKCSVIAIEDVHHCP